MRRYSSHSTEGIVQLPYNGRGLTYDATAGRNLRTGKELRREAET